MVKNRRANLRFSGTMKASDLFIECLEAEGVEYIFGVPGEENLDVLNSLKDSSIEVILTRNEQSAVFMAATYGRFTGKPGIAISTLGRELRISSQALDMRS